MVESGWRNYIGHEAHGIGKREIKRKRYLDEASAAHRPPTQIRRLCPPPCGHRC
jgi:hypothetical protein